MDGLGLALFGIFLVSFTISKPVSQHGQSTQSSSESFESNESSSSEEVTIPRTTLKPIELNTMQPVSLGDNLHQANDSAAHLRLAQTTLHPFLPVQEVVEFDLNISYVHLEPFVPVTGGPDAERLVSSNVTTPELRCYTVPLTSPEPKPVRGDNI
uniref:Uncharacterized protein n=2 Tax=Cyprinus carpio TaxID=7962 RepID=A0A9J7XK40_CYPCA